MGTWRTDVQISNMYSHVHVFTQYKFDWILHYIKHNLKSCFKMLIEIHECPNRTPNHFPKRNGNHIPKRN